MTDCDNLFDAPPEERERHLAECPLCARVHQAMQLAAAPEPAPLTEEFLLRLELAQDRPDPIPMWIRTVRRVRQGLTVAAAITAIITAGWVVHGLPGGSQLSDQQIEWAIQHGVYR